MTVSLEIHCPLEIPLWTEGQKKSNFSAEVFFFFFFPQTQSESRLKGHKGHLCLLLFELSQLQIWLLHKGSPLIIAAKDHPCWEVNFILIWMLQSLFQWHKKVQDDCRERSVTPIKINKLWWVFGIPSNFCYFLLLLLQQDSLFDLCKVLFWAL